MLHFYVLYVYGSVYAVNCLHHVSPERASCRRSPFVTIFKWININKHIRIKQNVSLD